MGSIPGAIGPRGPILEIKLMQSPGRVAKLKKLKQKHSAPVVVAALLDTGASVSAIDRGLVTTLSLESHGTTSIHTPSTGAAYQLRNQYDISFVIGELQPRPLVTTALVIESDFASEGFLALVGRDALDLYVFTYKGPAGRFSLAL